MGLNFHIYNVINVDVAKGAGAVHHFSSDIDDNLCVTTRKTTNVIFVVENDSFETAKYGTRFNLYVT